MYTITIVTKSGNTQYHVAAEELFQMFTGWLIGGPSSADSQLNWSQPTTLGNAFSVAPPCSTFLFEDGAVIRDNIDTVSWEQQIPHARRNPRFEIVDGESDVAVA